MCLFGKRTKALQEELAIKVNECAKLRDELNAKDRHNAEMVADSERMKRAIADMEKELKDRIKEIQELKSQNISKDNTIKRLKFDLAKYTPKRDKSGKFARK